MIQVLSALASHSAALLLYPGLLTVIAFGALVEIAWTAITRRRWALPDWLRRRPTPVLATVALCSILAAVQVSAPFNPMMSDERNLVVAAIALAFTAWAELALTVDLVPEPGSLLVIQFCWLLAVLGPAVQPESLRPQVLGNVLVPALLPLKVACGFLFLVCLPALLRLWPLPPPGDRHPGERLDAARAWCWLPYCALFTTLFFPPSGDDPAGVLRFFGISLLVAAVVLGSGALMNRRGAAIARRLYMRAVPPYAAVVLGLVLVTSMVSR
ncbi:hypothetical protein EPN29_11830 [bacterium]|nr:MAG: hypothetical protein EPN29_11830 [bacterium]